MSGSKRVDEIIYSKTIKANSKNLKEKGEEFTEHLKNAPKPGEYPDKKVIVNLKFEITTKKIILDDDALLNFMLEEEAREEEMQTYRK